MAFDAHKNLAISTVVTAPSPATSGTSLVVTGSDGARFPAPPFNATVWPSSAMPTPANAEVVRVTARTTDTLTIARAQEGTTARAMAAGDLIAASITAKTLTDLETQAALTAAANTFASPQTIAGISAKLVLNDTQQPADARIFDLVNYTQGVSLRALNDAQNAVHGEPLRVLRNADVYVGRNLYEAGRTTPLGHWQPWPFSASNFAGSGGMTWTVGPAAYTQGRYCLIGKTLFWNLYLSWFAGSNVLSGTASTQLKIAAPAGLLVAANQWQLIQVQYSVANAPTLNGLYAYSTGGNQITVMKHNDAAFALTDIPGLLFTLIFEVS